MDNINEEIKTSLDDKSPNQVEEKVNVKPVVNRINSNSIVNTNSNFNSLNLFNDKDLASAEIFLSKLMRSEKGGIKTVNDGLAVLLRAQDLKLPFSSCIEHIHVINGKTGIDIHIIKALLSKAGCTWRCTKDYQPLYEYTDGFNVYIDNSFPNYVIRCFNKQEAESKNKDSSDNVYVYPVKWYKDFNGNVYKDYQLNTNKFGIVYNKQQAVDVSKTGKIAVYRIPNNPVDYITEYEIFRTVNGKEISAKGNFSFSEAVKADMFTKDTYKKYPRVLIGHRAFTYAAREIASDILFGVSETTELKIMSNKDIDNNDIIDAEVIEIN